MKLHVEADDKSVRVREAVGTHSEILSLMCCIVDDVAQMLSESDIGASKSEIIRLVCTALTVTNFLRSPISIPFSDFIKDLEAQL